MWHDLLVALALVLIIEGMVPFLHPSGLRQAMVAISRASDNLLRLLGAASMLLGLVALYVIN